MMEAAGIAEELKRRQRTNRIASFFPDEGPLSRHAYKKHMSFFEAGKRHQERCFMAGNRVGKTIVGAYETTLHLTGDYPDWWPGHRFDHPTDGWAAGDTSETTRDIVQMEMLGDIGRFGTGMIPQKHIIGEPTKRAGVAGAVDQVRVQHVSGGVSLLGFKSYDQGRKKFQGTRKHFNWCDEEPPEDVYDEMMMRLMTTNGLMLATLTPLEGMTDIAMRYLSYGDA